MQNIKKIFILLILLIATQLINAQTTLLEQDFETASGTTPPTGWTVQTTVGEAGVDIWHFDNPGRRTPNTPVAGVFACFDSDKYSDNGQAEEVYLISPTFDATTTESIYLELDQYFLEGYAAAAEIEVYNGSSWTSIFSTTSTTQNPQHSQIDITAQIQNVTNAQIRFKWTGNYSWYWIIDNIKVTAQLAAADQFTEQTGISLADIFENGAVSWGDYDNDGDLDILLTGRSNSEGIISKVYKNNGDNTFTEQAGISLTGVKFSSVSWGDYDNDGYLDILLTGQDNSGNKVSKIYKNNGNNTFSEQTNISLTEVSSGSVAWGDYDNDGDLDILLTGSFSNVASDNISRIYKNNGDNTFTEQTDISLSGVSSSSVAWGDYDNDGYLDILLTGSTGYESISKIYKNNGDNTFTEQTNISLTGVSSSSVAWGDYDNDGYFDILLTGQDNSGNKISTIYKNNGDNTFTEQKAISLTRVAYGSSAWGDYDNDGDLDILLTGSDGSDNSLSKIYKNNGDNTFTEQTGISLSAIYDAVIAWGDYDNDGNLDILLAGSNISKIYKNKNTIKNTAPTAPQNLNSSVSGQEISFNWDKATDTETPQNGLSYNLVISSNPSDCDALTPMANITNGYRKVVDMGNTGKNNSFLFNSDLPAGTYYWGVQAIDNAFAGSEFATGSFTISEAQASKIKLSNITTSTATIEWTRGNKEKCAVFIKQTNGTELPNISNNTTYTANTVFGQGTEAGSGWFCIYNGTGTTINISGLSGSNLYKVMVAEYSGTAGHEDYYTFTNSSNPLIFTTEEQFTEQTGISLTGVSRGSVDWGDYDNDGDLDIILTGSGISKIYKNNGNNSFSEQTSISLIGVNRSSVVWGDYDNDGDLDILLTGQENSANIISKIYKNNGDNTFTKQIEISLTGVYFSSVAWGDYDNDGDLDILLTGTINDSSTKISKIYKNNGNNNFTEQTNITLRGFYYSSVAWSDYDNDGDLDIILTGSSDYGADFKIYKNNGDNSFTEQTNIALIGVYNSSVTWGDYDNDGDLDILITGSTSDGPSGVISKIYKNNGDNTFTEQTGISLTGVIDGSVAWGDYDNDGDLDILMTGSGISKIYKNNGDNSFTEQTNIALIGVNGSSVAWGDYDNDGDLDILLTGNSISKIYKNNNAVKNTAPNAPTGIVAYIDNGELHISWDRATDNETPQQALNYNLRVGTTPGGMDIVASMALANGKRSIAAMGNMQQNTSYVIKLPTPTPETVYYSLQTIDNGYLASVWSPEQSGVSKFIADFSPTTVCQQNDIQFEDKSYSIDYPISSWHWKFTEGTTVTEYDVQNPTHSFQTYGTHTAELTIINSNSDTTSRVKSIIVKPSPLSNFTADNVCEGTLTPISNTTDPNTLTVSDWLWDFGDGSPTSTAENPGTHSYNPGTYNLSLKANAASNGCSLSTTKEIIVAALPPKTLSIQGSSNFCTSENTMIYAVQDTNYSYQWLAGGANIQDSTNYNIFPKSTDTYSVLINNTLANNCSITSNSINITVKPSPVALTIIAPDSSSYCINDPASQLSTVLISGNTYTWLSNGNVAAYGVDKNTFIPTENGVRTYSLILTNTDGCESKSVNTVDLQINKIPENPTITVDGSVIICPGEHVILSVENSADLNYQWQKNGEIISGAVSASYTANSEGTYTVKITNNGCSTESPQQPITEKPGPPLPEMYLKGDQVWFIGCSVNEGVSYKWYRDGIEIPNSNSYILVPNPAEGSYYVTLDNGSICLSTSATVVIPDDFYSKKFKSFEEFKNELQTSENIVKIYPNPNGGIFTLGLNNNYIGKTHITIKDINGKNVTDYYNNKIQNVFTKEMNISEFGKGIYFIEIEYNGQRDVKKVIVE